MKKIEQKETRERTIIRYKNGIKIQTDDIIVNETTITISVQCQNLGTITCTPSNLYDLATGYLISSGIVWAKNKLIHIDFIEDENKFDVTLENNKILVDTDYDIVKPTGCASGDMLFTKVIHNKIKTGDVEIKSVEILALMQEFNKTSELFRATGGVHSSAISDNKKILVFREDIGRHNAVDKVIGAMYRNKMKLEDKILLTSGRISSEIVLKSINAGIQMIISRSAPTLKGIELAEENNIAVVGFARSNNFNIYSCFNKVVFDDL